MIRSASRSFGSNETFCCCCCSLGFNQQRIAKIIVMKMKRGLVVSVSIGLDDLPVGDLCILDEHIYIRAAFPICSADKPFHRKSMVGFMRRRHDRRETAHHAMAQGSIPAIVTDSVRSVCASRAQDWPLSVAERLRPPHTTNRMITTIPANFKAAIFNIAPTRCQSNARPTGRETSQFSSTWRGQSRRACDGKTKKRDVIGR